MEPATSLGGGGQFNITAHNIDLGTSGGIQSQGVAYDTLYLLDKRYRPIYDSNGQQVEVYPLTTLSDFTGGANITVTVSGNLDMFSTIISTVNGGNININAAGEISAGSDEFSGQGSAPRGIFTTAGGDVTVVANGDINVNGSRIATYDGGNVTVESLDGNVDAGHGAALTVTVDGYYVDPYVDANNAAQCVFTTAPQLPFSGILALTFPERNSTYPAPVATLGNILVEAPNGNVTANAAGILQIPLNNVNYPDAIVAVLAGYELLDSQGNPVTAGNLPATDAGWQQVFTWFPKAGTSMPAVPALLPAMRDWKPAATSSASFLPATTLTSTRSKTSTLPRSAGGQRQRQFHQWHD